MTIGERIKNLRQKLGLSAEQLGEKIGKDRATIYRYEKNEIENLPITTLNPLAKALNTTEGYLMGWESEEIILTNHEKRVIEAYRNKPEMQPAVDKLLGVESDALANDIVNTINSIGKKTPTKQK